MARILIVDDEPDGLLLTRVILEEAGYETLLAADGERALERLAEAGVDLMLLDVCMPIQDGWDVMRSVANSDSPVPVVVVSGRARAVDVDRARAMGVRDFVDKPYDPEVLKAAVAAVLGG